MGHRANFVILENNLPRIFFSRQGALKTPNILAQGLGFCEEYFLGFPEHTTLLPTVWAEGGILIDKDQRHILIFGGEDMDCIPALQRHFCHHIARLWPDWSVRWCQNGMVDIAEYLGLMGDWLLEGEGPPELFPDGDWVFLPDSGRMQSDVTTLIYQGITLDYKQDLGLCGINKCLSLGEKLKDVIPDYLKILKWQNEIETTDCLLVDYDAKKLFVCWGMPFDPRYDEKIRKIWNGWDLERQSEGLIFHFKYTHRDPSEVEMTKAQFESYCQKEGIFEFQRGPDSDQGFPP